MDIPYPTFLICLCLAGAAGFGLGFAAHVTTHDPPPWYVVTDAQAIDGDTVKISTVVHISGIEAPEPDATICPGEAERGREATARTNALLANGPVRVQVVGQDRSGRIVANVVAEDRPIGPLLTAEGLARRADAPISWCQTEEPASAVRRAGRAVAYWLTPRGPD